jgi:CheY-like chemotaxis protein
MRNVLYVEDDDLVRELFAGALRDAGFSVEERRFAEQGLDALRRHRPALILLDIGMPPGLMNGIDMLMRLREVPEWAQIPVVVFSGLTDVLNPDVMAHLNVSNVLSKATIDSGDLVGVVSNILEGDADQHR